MKKLLFKNGETIVKVRMSGNHWRKVRIVFRPEFFKGDQKRFDEHYKGFQGLNPNNPYCIESLYGPNDYMANIWECSTYFECVSKLNQEIGKTVFQVPTDPRLLEIDQKLMTVQIKFQEFIDNFSDSMDEELDGDIVRKIQEHLDEIEATRIMTHILKLA